MIELLRQRTLDVVFALETENTMHLTPCLITGGEPVVRVVVLQTLERVPLPVHVRQMHVLQTVLVLILLKERKKLT